MGKLSLQVCRKQCQWIWKRSVFLGFKVVQLGPQVLPLLSLVSMLSYWVLLQIQISKRPEEVDAWESYLTISAC